MTRLPTLFLALGCLFVLSPVFTPLNAQVTEICDNGVDDDADKLIDCDDPDCDCTPPPPTEICDNGVDDDADKLIDCDDPDCVCTPTKEICDNTLDDDGDGLIDCDDPECECPPKKEICDNKLDDDGDGLIDCDDPECDCPPEGVPCSHGFWKNHTELWFGICCTGSDCDDMLADLKAKGPGSEAIRQAVADSLEACLGRPCDETGDSKTVGDAIRDLNLLFCSSTTAPAVAGSEEKNVVRPVDVTATVANLHRVFQDA